jgi:hypothetical protein
LHLVLVNGFGIPFANCLLNNIWFPNKLCFKNP